VRGAFGVAQAEAVKDAKCWWWTMSTPPTTVSECARFCAAGATKLGCDRGPHTEASEHHVEIQFSGEHGG